MVRQRDSQELEVSYRTESEGHGRGVNQKNVNTLAG